MSLTIKMKLGPVLNEIWVIHILDTEIFNLDIVA